MQNINSFGEKVCVTYRINEGISYFYANFARKHIVFWINLHSWNFFTTVGRDSHDKFQVWPDDMADNTLYDMPYEMPDDMPKICLMICPKYA